MKPLREVVAMIAVVFVLIFVLLVASRIRVDAGRPGKYHCSGCHYTKP